MKEVKDIIIAVLSGLLILSIVGLVTNMGGSDTSTPTAYAVQTAPSQVVISNYVSIAKSDTLTTGIDFGTINSLPVVDQNGTGNYNGSSQSEYYISVSSDSNINVDFCIQQNTNLSTEGGDNIPNTNYVWSNSGTNDASNPSTSGTALTDAYVAGSTSIAPGADNFYRFFLDVDGNQAPGTYNNTVYFKGVPTGDGC